MVLCFKLKSLAQSTTASLYSKRHLESKLCKKAMISNKHAAWLRALV